MQNHQLESQKVTCNHYPTPITLLPSLPSFTFHSCLILPVTARCYPILFFFGFLVYFLFFEGVKQMFQGESADTCGAKVSAYVDGSEDSHWPERKFQINPILPLCKFSKKIF
jgi:hypothetical protein